jgi:PadR family transcriptional regulator PadR
MDTERELLKGNTPTLILAVLQETPRHGYAIAREIERRSNNALKCKEGTLYPALHALERQGLIVGEWRKEGGGRERKVYRITPAGLTALEQHKRTWNAFASAIERVIGGPTNAGTRSQPTGNDRNPELAF